MKPGKSVCITRGMQPSRIRFGPLSSGLSRLRSSRRIRAARLIIFFASGLGVHPARERMNSPIPRICSASARRFESKGWCSLNRSAALWIERACETQTIASRWPRVSREPVPRPPSSCWGDTSGSSRSSKCQGLLTTLSRKFVGS